MTTNEAFREWLEGYMDPDDGVDPGDLYEAFLGGIAHGRQDKERMRTALEDIIKFYSEQKWVCTGMAEMLKIAKRGRGE